MLGVYINTQKRSKINALINNIAQVLKGLIINRRNLFIDEVVSTGLWGFTWN